MAADRTTRARTWPTTVPILAACAGLLVHSLAGRCAAQVAEPPGFQAQLDEGVRLREQGRDAEALAVFRRAHEATGSPRALAQMGLAHQALGDWLEAEGVLARALAATDDPWIQRNRAALEGALAVIGRRLGSLEVQSNVEGAALLVNQRAVGTLPLSQPVRVLAGTAVIEVRAEGYYPLSRSVNVPAGGRARERFELVHLPSAEPGSTGASAVVTPGASPPGAQRGSERSAGPREGGGATMTVLGWVAAGAALATLGGGLGALSVREARIGSYNDDALCGDFGAWTVERCNGELGAADTAQTLAVVGVVSAGVLAVTASVLLLAPQRAQRRPGAALLGCGIDGRGGGALLVCAGAF